VGISNFGKACKVKRANSESAPKFQEWNWKDRPYGPPQYIAPELYQKVDTNKSHWEGFRFYDEMTDMYALGTSINKMCSTYFSNWENTQYVEWHDSLSHTSDFRERRGVESRLLHLLHRLSHQERDVRKSAKINSRQWRLDLGVNSGRVYRPLFGWSV
jgi:hypothetical protein